MAEKISQIWFAIEIQLTRTSFSFPKNVKFFRGGGDFDDDNFSLDKEPLIVEEIDDFADKFFGFGTIHVLGRIRENLWIVEGRSIMVQYLENPL